MLKEVGPYEVLGRLGRGGLGVVYLARDRRTQEAVALKVLRGHAAEAVPARRLQREFEALKGVDHPNVVRVCEAGSHGELLYLAMEFVDGLPLRSWLDATYDAHDWHAATPRKTPPAPSHVWEDDEPDSVPSGQRLRRPVETGGSVQAVPVVSTEALVLLNSPLRQRKLRHAVRQLAHALAFIHDRGLVHRDVKPGNVLVAPGGCVKLVDFGLVKVLGAHVTAAYGSVVGTYRYMAPEQARGLDVDARTDLYALGVVLYELLSGQPPFTQRQTAALLDAVMHTDPADLRQRNPGVDPMLAQLTMRLLRKDPAQRPASAHEVAALLPSES